MLDDQLLQRAQRLHVPSVEQLFVAIYPPVHRIAHALAGRNDVARGILRFVMTQAPRRLSRWRDIDSAQRWFLHHTLLTARRATQHQPKPAEDLLVVRAPASTPPYIAFIRALRALPFQQREAFILHHGEHLTDRSMAIAMDCSTRAADQHLQAAETALSAIAGAEFPEFRMLLSKAVASLEPEEQILLPSIRSGLRRLAWKQRIRRVLALAIAAALAVGAYYAYRFFRPH